MSHPHFIYSNLPKGRLDVIISLYRIASISINVAIHQLCNMVILNDTNNRTRFENLNFQLNEFRVDFDQFLSLLEDYNDLKSNFELSAKASELQYRLNSFIKQFAFVGIASRPSNFERRKKFIDHLAKVSLFLGKL